jgi:hypothetical protein
VSWSFALQHATAPRKREDARMRRLPSAKASALGVTLTMLAVMRELGWVFREQPTEDHGVGESFPSVVGFMNLPDF